MPTAILLSLALLQTTPPATPAPPPCASPEHRQLDFWVGDWDVVAADGRVLGRNTITRELGDCMVQEQWAGARGLRGRSFNIWQAGSKTWHQTWVDSAGNLLTFTGARDGEAMQLDGEAAGPDGVRIRHSMRLEPLADGRVRQLWRSSTDAGKTWKVVFEGFYVRRKGPATN